jgi:hypothetical protein
VNERQRHNLETFLEAVVRQANDHADALDPKRLRRRAQPTGPVVASLDAIASRARATLAYLRTL